MHLTRVLASRFLVLGAGKSGLAAAFLLKRHAANVVVTDDKLFDGAASSGAASEQLASHAVPIISPAEALAVQRSDSPRALVLSPGIPLTHPLVQATVNAGSPVIGEIELASAFVDAHAPIIAVTGTNGKTTVTAWIAHILRLAGKAVTLGGNIGSAWAGLVDQLVDGREPDCHVVEVSSYQLETIEHFHPRVTVLTNLAPDHLARYGNFDAYVAAKRNILRNMTPSDFLVWNWGNKPSHAFADGIPCAGVPFSMEPVDLPRSCHVENGVILWKPGDAAPVVLCAATEIPLPGRHNVENALAAAAAALLSKVEPEIVADGLRTFRGVEHRIEWCGNHLGVDYFNDSKATNVDSLEKALLSFARTVVLIAGGEPKGESFDAIAPLLPGRVRRVITLGQAAPLLEKSWAGAADLERSSSMADAVARAAAAARAGDVVLLSPACASFDMYNNFEERGLDFKSRVAELMATA